MRIQVSEYATALPSKRPLTDDMRDMVEHFAQLGLIQRIPAAFKLGADLVVMHPTLYDALRKHPQVKNVSLGSDWDILGRLRSAEDRQGQGKAYSA